MMDYLCRAELGALPQPRAADGSRVEHEIVGWIKPIGHPAEIIVDGMTHGT